MGNVIDDFVGEIFAWIGAIISGIFGFLGIFGTIVVIVCIVVIIISVFLIFIYRRQIIALLGNIFSSNALGSILPVIAAIVTLAPLRGGISECTSGRSSRNRQKNEEKQRKKEEKKRAMEEKKKLEEDLRREKDEAKEKAEIESIRLETEKLKAEARKKELEVEKLRMENELKTKSEELSNMKESEIHFEPPPDYDEGLPSYGVAEESYANAPPSVDIGEDYFPPSVMSNDYASAPPPTGVPDVFGSAPPPTGVPDIFGSAPPPTGVPDVFGSAPPPTGVPSYGIPAGDEGASTSVGRGVFNSDFFLEENDLQIVKQIGSGASGDVLLAKYHGSRVAVKQIRNKAKSEAAEKEFKEEFAALQALRHPNILILIGVTITPSNYSIVTEFCGNGSLYDVIQKKTLERSRLHKLFKQTCMGMAYLHSKEVIHRDLKSPNILLTAEWRVRIADFGLARSKTDSKVDSLVGSPLWMAPEVMDGSGYGRPADVYSFGIIMWECFSGKVPFDEIGNPMQVMFSVCKGTRPEIDDEVPSEYADIMRRCWDMNPGNRPTFEKLIDELEGMEEVI